MKSSRTLADADAPPRGRADAQTQGLLTEHTFLRITRLLRNLERMLVPLAI